MIFVYIIEATFVHFFGEDQAEPSIAFIVFADKAA
jgi:hypothetical protein